MCFADPAGEEMGRPVVGGETEGRERGEIVGMRLWVRERRSYFLLLVFHFPRHDDDRDSFKGVRCFSLSFFLLFFLPFRLNFTTQTKRFAILSRAQWIQSAQCVCTLSLHKTWHGSPESG